MGQELIYWFALQKVLGVGSVLAKRLIEHFGEPEGIFKASENELKKVEGVRNKLISALKNFKAWGEVKREKELVLRHQVKVITLKDQDYPRNLLSIYDSPSLLYVKGSLEEDDNLSVAIVGSRAAGDYGRVITEKISYELAEKGITIVSGMARGIDSAAHQGALRAGGRTLAVLGCGIDIVYPPENRGLAEKITTQGALITEFPFSTPPLPINFPRRNRLISGLSLGVVVVEAGLKSGSLITARLALEQGREVFAVPGSVNSLKSKGTHSLIKEGARLVEGAEDILSEILPQWKRTAGRDENRGERDKLSTYAENILNLISHAPLHIDEIIAKSTIKSSEVAAILLDLELKGWLRQLPGKMFVRVRV